MEPTEYRRKRSSSHRGRNRFEAPEAPSREGRPKSSGSSLLVATAASLVVAGVILLLAVLPAEFGIDPTGIGKVLGLSSMKASAADSIPTKDVQTLDESADKAETVTKSGTPMRADSVSVTLKPGEGAEVKAEMQAGERFVFEWTSSGGPVNFDMHGEEPGAGDQFTSYWADKQKESAAGVFVAPVNGTHGWFWRNRGDGPVTVKVQTSGFYSRLFRVK